MAFSRQMQDEFLELSDQGCADRDILRALKKKYGKVPSIRRVAEWRVRDRRENPISENAKQELADMMQGQLDLVGDYRYDMLESVMPVLMARFEDDEHSELKEMELSKLSELGRKLLSDIAQSAERVLNRKALEDAGLTQHQQVLINIQGRANAREEVVDGDSDVVIDTTAVDIQLQ